MTDFEESPRLPHFESGAKVRVKYGVMSPDFEDIPLGGWTGTIGTIQQEDDYIGYEIEWDQRTLAAMHPVYKKRCERDDLDDQIMWLEEEDIEPDDGTTVPIEQPTEIITPPLSNKDQDDRVRMALGLTHDDPLPEISVESLLTYHRYLATRLTFPFKALQGEEAMSPYSRKRSTLTVTGLLDPETEEVDLESGLLCICRRGDEVIEFPLGDIEVKKKDPNFKPVSDYAYWFYNWPTSVDTYLDPEPIERVLAPEKPATSTPSLRTTILLFAAGGGLLGATISVGLRTSRGAGLASMIGGVPAALLGALMLGSYGRHLGTVNRISHSTYLGVVFGLVIGGMVGMLAGMTLVALPWSLVGLAVGWIVGPHLLGSRRRVLGTYLGMVLGTCVSIVFLAFRQDQGRA